MGLIRVVWVGMLALSLIPQDSLASLWSDDGIGSVADEDAPSNAEGARGNAVAIAPQTRLDQLQVLGSHNSYHMAPGPVASRLIALASPQGARALSYTHPPLEDQLGRLGLRQLELDLYRDPDGGLYAEPLAVQIAKQEGGEGEPFEAEPWRRSGTKVLHAPDFDFRTRCISLQDALETLKRWSAANAGHCPIFVLLELKNESYAPTTRPPAWDAESLAELEREILAVVPREQLLTPDDVRGSFPTLREAVREGGWPSLAAARGRLVLLLDNEDGVRDVYLQQDESLRGRLVFVSVDVDHPAAAFRKLNDPVRDFDRIRESVAAGLLVRTRADSELSPLRDSDWQRRDRALASGAQLISTDFPEPHPEQPEYVVRWGDGEQVRYNPITSGR